MIMQFPTNIKRKKLLDFYLYFTHFATRSNYSVFVPKDYNFLKVFFPLAKALD